MAKITDVQTPFGASGNILSPSSWLQMILGVVMFLIVFAIGQNVKDRIGSKLPIDTTIDPIIRQPVAATNSPAKRVY
jgi:hypothetical protein